MKKNLSLFERKKIDQILSPKKPVDKKFYETK